MNRDDDLEPILGPWMARNAPRAPGGLLQDIIARVDAVEQRTTRWPSWVTVARPLVGVASTALVALLLVAIGLVVLNRVPAPGAQPDADSAYVERYLDLLRDGTAEEFTALYAPNALMFSPETDPAVAQGREEIATGFKVFHDFGTRLTLSGAPSRYGPFLTYRFTWENDLGSHGTGVTTLLFNEQGLITHESTLIVSSP